MSNCLFFAIRKWKKHGGYVIVRKSHYGWWPHFIWSGDLITFEQFVPNEPKKGICPPPIFRGTVVISEKDYKDLNA